MFKGEDTQFPVLHGTFSASYQFAPGLGVQGDAVIQHQELESFGTSTTVLRLDGAAHVYYRTEDVLLGTFAQIGEIEYTSESYNAATRFGYLGIEGQVYLDNLTLYAQVGLTGLENEYTEGNGWFGTIEARYFLTPDFMVSASAGLVQYDLDYGMDFSDTTTNAVFGAGAEFKLPDLPLSLTVKADYVASRTANFGDAARSTRVMLGIKFGIGEDTLLDRDRGGVTLKPVDFGDVQIGNVI